jgi:glycosyltransferase involved in cell wall biosynthesis
MQEAKENLAKIRNYAALAMRKAPIEEAQAAASAAHEAQLAFGSVVVAHGLTIKSPRVSAICLTRGTREHLEATRACLAAQTRGPIELVLVSDVEVETRKGEILVPCKTEQSLGNRRNLGVNAATGDILIQLDDDDLSHPERVARQVAALQEGALGCVLDSVVIEEMIDGARARLGDVGGWAQTLCVWREWLLAVPYRDSSAGEDAKAMNAVNAAGLLNIIKCDLDLYTYRHHGANVSGRRHWDWLLEQRGVEPLNDAAHAVKAQAQWSPPSN